MAVARISIMRPLEGRGNEVERLLDEFEEYVSKYEGYILGFRFASCDESDEIGRIALWASQEQANHVAIMDHVFVLRARIHRAIKPGHIELLVDLKGAPRNIPGLPTPPKS